ncbi:transcriptional coactivator p15/PC4 family protein [Candidatus Omnitrophota bacterium]
MQPTKDSSLVFDIIKTSMSIVRIKVSNYKGAHNLDIRTYYRDDPVDDYKPTRKGVTISLEKIGNVINALQEIKKKEALKITQEAVK